LDLRYDLEADWVLLTTCNYRCEYCFFPQSALGALARTHATNEEWARAFGADGGTWLIHMTGGEPFVYPNFVDLCERLTARHFLSLNTNLSHRTVDAFAGTVDPERVHFVNAALHPVERERRMEEGDFVERVLLLRRRGFRVFASVVMTPDVLARFDEIFGRYEARGVPVAPKVLRGRHGGRTFPSGYTAEERAAVRRHVERARIANAALIAAMGEPPTINVFADDRLLDRPLRYWGKMCGSGHRFARIEADGTVVRCGSKKSLGNILAGDVRWQDGPRRCWTSYCPYYCEKYTSARFVSRGASPTQARGGTIAR